MPHTVEYYLQKGFAPAIAEYFSKGRRTIMQVIANDDFTLTLFFDNGEKRLFDVAPMLKKGTVFETFIDINEFKRVYLDEQHCVAWDIDPTIDSNLFWNNKVDICPDSCYIDSIAI